jgi:hypothetical protein
MSLLGDGNIRLINNTEESELQRKLHTLFRLGKETLTDKRISRFQAVITGYTTTYMLRVGELKIR